MELLSHSTILSLHLSISLYHPLSPSIYLTLPSSLSIWPPHHCLPRTFSLLACPIPYLHEPSFTRLLPTFPASHILQETFSVCPPDLCSPSRIYVLSTAPRALCISSLITLNKTLHLHFWLFSPLECNVWGHGLYLFFYLMLTQR